MSRYFSSQVSRLTPYTPGEQPKDQQYVKLNANESPYPPSPGVAAALNAREAAGLRLYGDAAARELKEALARQYKVEPENVFVANGSDEALNFAFLSYATDGRGVAFADFTYSFYPVFCDLYHIPAQIVPLREDFTLVPEDYYGLNKTIVITNPNAPTGLAISRDQVEGIVKANPDSVVVIDEAYVDFGGESSVALTKRYPNLLVVQVPVHGRGPAGLRHRGRRPDPGPGDHQVFHQPLQREQPHHEGRNYRPGGAGLLRRELQKNHGDPGVHRPGAGEAGLHRPALQDQLPLCQEGGSGRQGPVPGAEGAGGAHPPL